MIVAVGVDICSIERMRRALGRHGAPFFDRLCSPQERLDMAQSDEATFLAGRFAAKEAFSKCLDGARGVGWHEVEVRRGPTGRPSLELSGEAHVRATTFGATRWHVSISHDAGAAVAVVVLEGAAT